MTCLVSHEDNIRAKHRSYKLKAKASLALQLHIKMIREIKLNEMGREKLGKTGSRQRMQGYILINSSLRNQNFVSSELPAE